MATIAKPDCGRDLGQPIVGQARISLDELYLGDYLERTGQRVAWAGWSGGKPGVGEPVIRLEAVRGQGSDVRAQTLPPRTGEEGTDAKN